VSMERDWISDELIEAASTASKVVSWKLSSGDLDCQS